MYDEHEPADNKCAPAREWVWPAGIWLLGMLMSFYPTLVSGFGFVQGGRGDSRLVNFTLEHSYRWLSGMPLAESLWSPPIFFPVHGVAAYTDLMLGVAPLYWPWRLVGFAPLTAFQLWMFCTWSLNFLACYLLLRRGIGLQPWGASAGAYLFAFASPRFMSLAHQQLAPQFFLVASLAGLIVIFKQPHAEIHARRRWVGSIAFWGGLLLQFYTAIYPFLFFSLALMIAGVVTLAVDPLRHDFLIGLKRSAIPIAVVGLLTLGLTAPLANRYRVAAGTLGVRAEHQVHLPKILSWILPGHTNRVYGPLQRALPLDEYRGFSQTNGIGVITLTACVVGLWLGRRRPAVQLIVLAMAGLVLMTITIPGGWSPWWMVRKLIPGTAALRAVARVGLTVLYPAALGLAIAFDRLAGRRKWLIACTLALCVVAEQAQRKRGFDKLDAVARVERIAAEVPVGATSFLLTIGGKTWDRHVHDDAAWVALATGVPTINGRYGNFPPDYPFRTPWIRDESEKVELRTDLDSWATDFDLVPAETAFIVIEPKQPRKR